MRVHVSRRSNLIEPGGLFHLLRSFAMTEDLNGHFEFDKLGNHSAGS